MSTFIHTEDFNLRTNMERMSSPNRFRKLFLSMRNIEIFYLQNEWNNDVILNLLHLKMTFDIHHIQMASHHCGCEDECL